MALVLKGVWPAVSQHDPPQQPHRVGVAQPHEAKERNSARIGQGEIPSAALPHGAWTTRENAQMQGLILRADSQEDVVPTGLRTPLRKASTFLHRPIIVRTNISCHSQRTGGHCCSHNTRIDRQGFP
jgi:hypothetical protein